MLWPIFPKPRIQYADAITEHWAEQDYADGWYLAQFEASWTAADHRFLSEITRACENDPRDGA